MHPGLQVLALLALSFICASILMGVGSALGNVLYGVDAFSDPDILSQVDDPDVVNANRILLFFNHLGFFILPALLLPKLMKYPPAEFVLINRKPSLFHGLTGVVLLILAFPIMNWLYEINQQFDFLGFAEEMESHAEEQFKAFQNGGIGVLILNLFLVALLPAISEELFFRGVLQKLLSRFSKNKHVGVWVSAFIFSFIHFQFYGFLPRMLYGALFGYLVVWSGSLLLPILLHFLNNANSLVLYYLSKKEVIATETGDAGEGMPILWVIVFVVLFGIVMWFFAKRSRWKEIEYTYLHH